MAREIVAVKSDTSTQLPVAERRVSLPLAILWLLLFLTALALLQRAFFRRSSLSPVAVESSLSPGSPVVDLRVYRVRPEPFSSDTYQLAHMVQSLKPEAVLSNRIVVQGPVGEVALGRSPAGRLALQTCLMDSGRAAVTHTRMLEEVRFDGPVSLRQRMPLLLRGVLLGRPLTSRPCLLVQLTAAQPLPPSVQARAEAESQLLQVAWPLLEGLAPVARRNL